MLLVNINVSFGQFHIQTVSINIKDAAGAYVLIALLKRLILAIFTVCKIFLRPAEITTDIVRLPCVYVPVSMSL